MESLALLASFNFPNQISRSRYTEINRGADKSLARPGRKQTTAPEDFDVHIPYLLSKLEEYIYIYIYIYIKQD